MKVPVRAWLSLLGCLMFFQGIEGNVRLFADINFILDSSGSVTKENFDVMKDFMLLFVNKMQNHLGADESRLAVINFASQANLSFNFGECTSDIRNCITNLEFIGSGTQTDEALDLARTQVFSKSRQHATKIGVLMTDGASNYPAKTVIAASRLKESGVDIVTVGIGSGINITELNIITSPLPFVFQTNFTSLQTIVDTIYDLLCWMGSQPDLSACNITLKDEYNHETQSGLRPGTTSTHCRDRVGRVMKTQPKTVLFDIQADVTLNLTNFPYYSGATTHPVLGVIGEEIAVFKVGINGVETRLARQILNGTNMCDKIASPSVPLGGNQILRCRGNLVLPSFLLQNAERICADIIAYAGGYIRFINVYGTKQDPFPTASQSKRICFLHDTVKPVHCTETSSRPCTSSPLRLSTRLTRTANIVTSFDGWADPYLSGAPSLASGIKQYKVEVHRVDINGSVLSVEEAANTTKVIDVSQVNGLYSLNLILPPEEPRLYAVLLETIDSAENVGYARRLVMFDNSSSVAINTSAILQVTSADPRSNFLWQTNISGLICLRWRDRFYNTYFRKNNFLKPVTRDTARDIEGIYDQETGILPVRGTENVDGIIRFEMSWSLDGGEWSQPITVSNLQTESDCFFHLLQDGQTYNISIRAVDYIGNWNEDSVTVHVDHSDPEVVILGLRGRFGREGLHVHNSTDVSKIVLVVQAFDLHSGISTLMWTFRTSLAAAEIGHGAVGVQSRSNLSDCGSDKHCYCPVVGQCEARLYNFTFGSLGHIEGQHNREYFITVNVTNDAGLSQEETVEILIDVSPPSVGVVAEGLSSEDKAEMDFTANDVLHVRWYGFLDHESGVLMYRVVLAEGCLSSEEMDNANNSVDVVGTAASTSINFPAEGLFFTSVVAYNGAMTPSAVACSDGIRYDTTPPELTNVSLIHARTARTIGCSQTGQPWLINQNLTRTRLFRTENCTQWCQTNRTSAIMDHIPATGNFTLEEDVSNDLCQRLKFHDENQFILLPSDYVRLQWVAVDEQSEMEEYYVGIGQDRTSSSAPDLLPFMPTRGYQSYNAQHSGLSHGAIFLMFLRVISKTGLSRQLDLGPILIDATGPYLTQPLIPARIENDSLMVTWADDTFRDEEQPKGWDFEITFRIGHEDGFVTPTIPMPDTCTSAQVNSENATKCIRYPLTSLHLYDTEVGRHFFFQLHVANAAGHVLIVDTSSVRLPSRFPPGHAVILDILDKGTSNVNPNKTDADLLLTNFTNQPENGAQKVSQGSPLKDVDVILQTEKICASWRGFQHPEDFILEYGVGTVPGADDTIPFRIIQNNKISCLNISALPTYQKFYSVLRATSTGGSTVVSSDGFVMIPREISNREVIIFNGLGCKDNTMLERHVPSNGETYQISKSQIHPGDFLYVRLEPFVPNVTFENAIHLQDTLHGFQIVAKSSNITITLPKEAGNNTMLDVLHCEIDYPISSTTDGQVAVSWEITAKWLKWANYLQISILDYECFQNPQQYSTDYAREACRLFSQSVTASEISVQAIGIHIQPMDRYIASLTPCFDDGCLSAVISHPVTYYSGKFEVTFSHSILHSQTSQAIEVEFIASVDPDLKMGGSLRCLFLWTVARDSTGQNVLSPWRLEETAVCSELKIKDFIKFEGVAHGTLYVCILPVSPWKGDNPVCSKILRLDKSNTVDPHHVIEIDHVTFRETDFKEYLHSQQLGSKLHNLYDFDIDFARSNIMITAVFTNSFNRTFNWFLMTSPRLPVDGDCEGDSECITSKLQGSGEVIFPRLQSKLQSGHTYFVCASTTNQDVQECGDGVVIDDTPPVGGVVNIINAAGGYSSDGSRQIVQWEGFSDVEVEVTYLPDKPTLTYSVGLGTYPGAEDLAPFVDVGQRTTWVFENIALKSGFSCVASVKATDRVGHVTVVSSQPVIIDNTPPTTGKVYVGDFVEDKFIRGTSISVKWEGIEDLESGVQSKEVAIIGGSSNDVVFSFVSVDGSSTLIENKESFVDGHSYTVLLKSTNRAGLSTLTHSSPFIVDSSPPGAGVIWNSPSDSQKHSSYSTKIGLYHTYWKGFTDPHSGLAYYRVGLGSKPNDTDVESFIYVGLQTFFTWKRSFDQGAPYYTILEACNHAGLCSDTSSSSFTFDNSPPTPGRVIVGFNGQHRSFVGHSSLLHVQWTGFVDPQTEIEEFAWCVGTRPVDCDVAPLVSSRLSVAALRRDLSMPVNTPLFASVLARNRAGLETVSSSESFKVDNTPPERVISPYFVSPSDGLRTEHQWHRSILHLHWLFRDLQSSVVSHTIKVRSQLTGRLVTDTIHLSSDHKLILALTEDQLLMDGDKYWAEVTACNSAGLCTSGTSSFLLIDSTPPTVGRFASSLLWTKIFASVENETDDVQLSSNVTTVLNISWQEFYDDESGIQRYFITAGRQYNSEELTFELVRVSHDNSSFIQNTTLELTEALRDNDVVYLSICAENGLGLHSPVSRMAFRVLQDNALGTSGSLISIRHSCSASYCTKECTCAPAGQVCDKENYAPCEVTNLDAPGSNLTFKVVPYIGQLGMIQNITTTAKCLEGHWKVIPSQAIRFVSRFEWSFSLANASAGEGIFEMQSEAVWHDVGLSMTAVHCLPARRMLTSGQRYVLHVRTWLSDVNSFATTSPPVLIDHTAPQRRRGKFVLESDASCSREIDFITFQPNFTACWSQVFSDPQSEIIYYEFWIGTSPHGDDHLMTTSVGLNTNLTVSTEGFQEGTRYYVGIRAWNGAGLSTSATSDGIVIDVTPPISGVVFANSRYTDVHDQSSADSIDASWFGFEDRHSGVVSYHMALFEAGDLSSEVVPWTTVGFKTEHILTASLKHNNSYVVGVYAVDKAGLKSSTVYSSPVLVDTTPPEGLMCTSFKLIQNKTAITQPSLFLTDFVTYEANFTFTSNSSYNLMKVNIIASDLSLDSRGYIETQELRMPLYFKFGLSGLVLAEHIFIISDASMDGSIRVVIESLPGANLNVELYLCVESTSTSSSDENVVMIRQMSEFEISVCSRIYDPESGVKSLLVGIGTSRGGLQVQPFTSVGHSGHFLMDVLVQHGSPVYATVIAENHAESRARFISRPVIMDRTGPEVSRLNVTTRSEDGRSGTRVFTSADWVAEDAESGVEACICVLEGSESLSKIQQETSDVTPGRCSWLMSQPKHDARVRVTVTCLNGVQIRTTAISESQILLVPPNITQAIVTSACNDFRFSPYDQSDLVVRSGNEDVIFSLQGLSDPTTQQIEYRFLRGSFPLTNWSPLPDYRTTAVLKKSSLTVGNITAEFRAVNARSQKSDTIPATIRVDDSTPLRTGSNARVVVNGDDVLINWGNVFRVSRDVTYTLFAGTNPGFGDVINHVTTKLTSYQGPYIERTSRLFVIIQAFYSNGQSASYEENFIL